MKAMKMPSIEQSNLWHHSAENLFLSSPHDGHLAVDVVVIGGGYTGLSAALHLSEAGVKTCVLEADSIGHGGSGRNVGLVNAGLWTPPDVIERRIGSTAGKKLNTILASGPSLVFDLIEKHQIPCEHMRCGTLHCAAGYLGLKELDSRFRQQRKRNAPVQLLSAEETARRTGTHQFVGSLFDERAGTIQPHAYAHGLAHAAENAGARIFQNTPAVSISKANGHWNVKTPNGTVVGQKLVQATNAYGIGGVTKNQFTPAYYFQSATQPLPKELRQKILPGGEGCWDTATIMSSFRMDKAGRLLIGGVGNLKSFGGNLHYAWAHRKMQSLFPELSNVELEYVWGGRIAVTNDHLPKIVEFGDGAISIFGYSGRGIAPGTIFGRSVADWFVNDDPSAFPIEFQPCSREPLKGTKSFFYEAGATLFHMVTER